MGWLKIGIGFGCLLILSGLLMKAVDYGEQRAAAKYQQAHIEQLESERQKIKAESDRADEADRRWRNAKTELEASSARPLFSVPIRLCAVSAPIVMPTTGDSAVHDGASSDSGHEVPISGDLGPALQRYAEQCEQLRQFKLEVNQWATESK